MYKVIKTFADAQDENHIYHVGDKFPRSGISVSAKRLEELSTAKNRRGTALIEEVGKKEPESKEVVVETEKPVNETPKKKSRKKKENVENAD